MKPGRFIVFDGVDGSGKTFLMNAVKAELEKRWLNVKTFRTIGEGHYGQKIRDILLGAVPETGRLNPISESMLFLAAIRDCTESHVKPWIEAGNIALMDRYVFSTISYQKIALRLAYEKAKGTPSEDIARENYDDFRLVESIVSTMRKPDLSVIAEVGERTATANVMERGEELNHLDNFCLNNFPLFADSYSRLFHNPMFGVWEFMSVDNNRPYQYEGALPPYNTQKSMATVGGIVDMILREKDES